MGLTTAFCQGKSFVLKFWEMSKVNEDSQRQTSRMKVIKRLGGMVVYEVGTCFQLDNDLAITNEVCFESLFDYTVFKSNSHWRLGHKRDSSFAKFNFQTLMVDRFQEATSQLVVDLKTSSNNLVTLVGLVD